MEVLVVGGGPAGLAAAEVASAAGARVLVTEQKPSVGRKFLMAGKSGLNLTKDASPDELIAACGRAELAPMLRAFDAAAVQDWARGLGQEVFTGSSGRVFPVAMKGSPLLRAWLARLEAQGVEFRTRWRWLGGERFETRDGVQEVPARATVLAVGGASWSRLGSDGAWAGVLGGPLAPFRPANMGFDTDWSPYMARWAGAPVKGVALHCGGHLVEGEFVVSAGGVEGSAIYALSAPLRDAMGAEGVALELDLAPRTDAATLTRKLQRPRRKDSVSNWLRKATGLQGVKAALLREGGPLPSDPEALAARIKATPLHLTRPRPLDEAISVAGGVPFDRLDGDLMLTDRPRTFCAGEMLDWEAPTGGYLLTACIATGRWAGAAAARHAGSETGI
ncbi:TIGR03862 family flavoprotein [Pontivivens ytuae]|uniref:TIGR03862 family flavoprotein n=1 Tax=Pontivivens ytuae TaxID=2789856 RepID=A0A7S9LNC9_9RHOB|nr:TIGR03862 family flavoprotein [Pontivivens ytuae]QPH52273.1 TIGR03862 family flavoprotein [Pontivivens ytuae]